MRDVVPSSAETRMRAKTAYSQYWYAAQAQRVTEGLRAVMSDLEQIARARYSSGLAPQQDVIKAQTELTGLRTDLVMIGSERRQAAARLNGVMARPADAPLAEPRELRPVPSRAFDFAALTKTVGERSPTLAHEHGADRGGRAQCATDAREPHPRSRRRRLRSSSRARGSPTTS